MEPRVELWIPRDVGVENLIRQIKKFNCDYMLKVRGDTIRFSCSDDELFRRIQQHTPQAREIYIVS